MYNPVLNPLHNSTIAQINPVVTHRPVYVNQPSLPVMYRYARPFYFPYFFSYVPAFPNISLNIRACTHYQPLATSQVSHGILFVITIHLAPMHGSYQRVTQNIPRYIIPPNNSIIDSDKFQQ